TETGLGGYSEFVRAPRAGYRLRLPFLEVLRINRQTLREGMFWITLTVLGMQTNVQIFAYITSGTFILVALAWALTPFLFNPHRLNGDDERGLKSQILSLQTALAFRDAARAWFYNMVLLPVDFWRWLRREPYGETLGNNVWAPYLSAWQAMRNM